MAGRPKTVSDERVLQALQKTLDSVGPGKLTLAAVGRRCGLSAASVLRRFGSRERLLQALFAHRQASWDSLLEEVDGTKLSPLAAIFEALALRARFATPDAAARFIATSMDDLLDPSRRALQMTVHREILEELEDRIQAAMNAREIQATDAATLARRIMALYYGAIYHCAVLGAGSSESYVRGMLSQEAQRLGLVG